MAKNDRLLLDGIIDDRVVSKQPSEKRDEAFEYLALEQILKEFDLSTDEILYGSIDGRGDGGIDGFFILVNGHLLQDVESFVWPRSNSELKLVLISCKHHDTFKQATLDSLIATLTELLDFSIDDVELKGGYSEDLLRMRGNLKFAYRKLSPRLANFTVNVYYASRGDTGEIGDEVAARGRQIALLAEDSFRSCTSNFTFVGATELVELHRKFPNYSLELPFVEALSKGERYVVLARLSDYYKFISDGGKLRRYLFESNVRDFMGLNRVNEDIKVTLDNKNSPDFWWLNNGVTVLATSAAITGKSIQVSDIQIVNGLQTTESIFRHFEQEPGSLDDRCVLVKVIVTKDEAIRDAIIRATNNQTDVELASLHATDKIQRDIEDVFLRHGLFYERRKNFYANQGHPPAELVTPLYAAAGYVALMLKKPHIAASLRSKFMRSTETYEAVFDEAVQLDVWPRIVQLLKKVDIELEILRPQGKATDRFLKGWRYVTAFLVLAQHFRKFTYSATELATLDVSQITPQAIEQVWHQLNAQESASARMGGWTSRKNVLAACEKAASTFGITGGKALSNTQPVIYQPSCRTPLRPVITSEFVERVRALLPPQPWKPGINKKVCAELGCETSAYFAAVEMLIEDGVFLRQRDGVLYDPEGNVVAFDTERVDPDTLELLTNKT
ncbi:AIPR family protein [Methylomonas sp. MED-D]|uniref:AIPR family protein n=1 Tax=unclassified Methylomonas TaxID=2608980 RepID=UPI0028A3FA6B|nr:AIPR family protein [Methylomonas sp. MV1]MDT4330700.1 AIPR family protein [Methylomonas sp. MV1]